VAISPELPDQSLSTREKGGLKFPVLSDVGNELARRMGIIFRQPEPMRSFFASNGIDFKTRYGNESLEVPIPATFLVDKKGVIRNTFIDADYTKRLEPTTALAWIDGMQGEKLA